MTQIADSEVLTPERLLEVVGNREGFAALHGAPEDVVSLALAGLPRGTRISALDYGLLEQDEQGRLSLTDVGRAVVVAAAASCPEPFRDVTVADLIRSMQATVDELNVGEETRLAEPVQVTRSLSGATTDRPAAQIGRLALEIVRRGGHALSQLWHGDAPTTNVHR